MLHRFNIRSHFVATSGSTLVHFVFPDIKTHAVPFRPLKRVLHYRLHVKASRGARQSSAERSRVLFTPPERWAVSPRSLASGVRHPSLGGRVEVKLTAH